MYPLVRSRPCSGPGLTLALDKCTPPKQSITWLGFVIDSVNMSVMLPIAQVQEVLDECILWSQKTNATCKQLQSLAQIGY